MTLAEYLATSKTSQTAFAKAVGVSQGMVWQWLNGVRPISAEKVIPIEVATNGAVTRHELRPDLYPAAEPVDSKARMREAV